MGKSTNVDFVPKNCVSETYHSKYVSQKLIQFLRHVFTEICLTRLEIMLSFSMESIQKSTILDASN